MDFNDTPEETKFRKEASDWLSANATLKDDEEAGNYPGMGEDDALTLAKNGLLSYMTVAGLAYIGPKNMEEEVQLLLKG